jgi:hypothetical protein
LQPSAAIDLAILGAGARTVDLLGCRWRIAPLAEPPKVLQP